MSDRQERHGGKPGPDAAPDAADPGAASRASGAEEAPSGARGATGAGAGAAAVEAGGTAASGGAEHDADAASREDAAPGPIDAPTGSAPPRGRPKVVHLVVMSVFAIAAFATGLVVFNYLLMPGLIHSKAEVRVPDVHQLSLDQAEAVLGQHGLQVSRAGERFETDVPRGFIISQDPGPGSPVRRQKTVQVIVSLGEEFSSVPALYGESRRSAEQLLKSAGLALGRITRAPSTDMGDGLVLASDPPAESVLPRDTPVSLLVSAGAGQEAFLMPDLLGREISRARSQLEAFGLHVRVPPGSAPIGTIVFQQPRPGAQISRRDTVVLQALGRLIR